MVDGGFLQLLLEIVERAEIAVDRRGEIARRRGLRRRQAVPVKGVVPRLGAVVEQALVARSFGVVDDFLEALVRKVGAFDRSIDLVDISIVMFAMMRRERVGRSEEHTYE